MRSVHSVRAAPTFVCGRSPIADSVIPATHRPPAEARCEAGEPVDLESPAVVDAERRRRGRGTVTASGKPTAIGQGCEATIHAAFRDTARYQAGAGDGTGARLARRRPTADHGRAARRSSRPPGTAIERPGVGRRNWKRHTRRRRIRRRPGLRTRSRRRDCGTRPQGRRHRAGSGLQDRTRVLGNRLARPNIRERSCCRSKWTRTESRGRSPSFKAWGSAWMRRRLKPSRAGNSARRTAMAGQLRRPQQLK